jgi:signal peptidase I
MEPTLNCAKPAPGCLGTADDHVLVQPGKPVKRGDIVAFKAPSKAAVDCAMIMGGVYLKRVVGLPGDTVHEDGQGFIHINGKRPSEPYVPPEARRQDALHGHTWHVAKGGYFLMGDNRPMSCDSRTWGSVPQHKIIGPVVKIIHMH